MSERSSGAETHPVGRSEEALAAYDAKAQAAWQGEDPRDQPTYMGSKMRCDYALVDRVGIEGKSVLNVGCSFPVDELHYARKVGSWTAVDLSEDSLREAEGILRRELHPGLVAKFRFRSADACDLPFPDGSFDLAVSMSTFDHLPTATARQKAVDEMGRVVRPGGHVVVTVANWWNLPYAAGIWKMSREKTLHYGYAYLFSPVELRRIVRKAGLVPQHFASSIAPPRVWLPGYPFLVRYPAALVFKALRAAGLFGRRIGFACRKP
ncbi:MAG: class I SAM-dependent methyltransferase [Thermoanaerobaculia bacterium]